MTPTTHHFDGPEFIPARDGKRLTSQLERVKALMSDGHWRTLQEIADETSAPTTSASAQLRHLRKPRFGKYIVDRRHVGGGLFEYALREPEATC